MVLLFSAAFTHAAPTGEESRPVVRVAGETVAHGEQLTLGDIAKIISPDQATAERLRAISLGYAPNVGAVREITRDRIVLAIAAAGFGSGAVRIETPERALVRRAAQVVDPALIREAVERATLVELRASGAAARLVRLDLPPVIEVPSGTVEARASTLGVRDLFTPFAVAIELRVDNRVVGRLSATAQVEAYAPVIVAAHDLRANSRVRAEDVTIAPRRITHPFSFYLRDITQLRGVSVRQPIAHGEPLTTDEIVSEIVVKPGDPVRITGQDGPLHITVAGEARAAGRVGDRIQVKNIQSGTLLQAVIVDEGLVSVRF